MIDRERVLAKLDEMDGYLRELESIRPASLEQYRRVETRRACERLLQVSVECVIDVCHLLVAGLRSGLPAEESDLFDKLLAGGVVTATMHDTLKRMKGCRNILKHDYARVLDEIVFDIVSSRLGDFQSFRREVLDALARHRGVPG